METLTKNTIKNVLVVDDDLYFRDTIKDILDEEGYNVDLAVDGNQGLDLQNKNQYDLIITDIVMPNKEGLEFIIDLQKGHPDIKIIAMTGANESYLKFALEFGVKKTIRKPFKNESLIKKISELQ